MRSKSISQCVILLVALLSSPALLAQSSEDATLNEPAVGADDSEITGAPGDKDPAAGADEDREPAASESSADEGGDGGENTGDDDTIEASDAITSGSPPVTTEIRRVEESAVVVNWNNGLDDFNRRYRWRLALGGYIRARYTNIEDDPSGTFGLNDGFGLANARFTLDGSMGDALGFRFQFDGAVTRTSDANAPGGELVMGLKDVFLFWQPLELVRLQVGQFKAPFDVEELISTSALLFVDRSVGSRGVKGIEGANVDGLSLDREVGAMLTTDDPVFFGGDDEPTGFGASYALAATNGAPSRFARNDNEYLAYYGRLGLHWGSWLRLGGAYYTNDATEGEAPDQIAVDLDGWTADLTFTGYGFTTIASIIQTESNRPDLDVAANTTALAYQASIAYQEPFFGFQPAFRYASYDPTSAVDDPTDPSWSQDALTHYTIGLNYNPAYPVRLMLNYTITDEEPARALSNDRFDALLQVVW